MKKELIFFILLGFGLFGMSSKTLASTVSLDPENSTVDAGNNFQLEITIDSLENLAAIDFHLDYDSDVITFEDAELGETFTVLCPDPLIAHSTDSSGLYFHAERSTHCSPYNFSTTKTVAILTFRAGASGSYTALEFSENELFINPTDPESVSATWVDGTVAMEDQSAPTIQITSPTSNSSIDLSSASYSVTFSGTATDNFAVFSVSCQLAGSPVIFADNPSDWECVFDLENGTNSLIFTATDYAGLTANTSLTINFSKQESPQTNSVKKSGSKKKKHKKHKKTKSKRSIKNSSSSIPYGGVIIQSGKKFTKNGLVALYFSKYGGGYYPPKIIQADSKGNFSLSAQLWKPRGDYNWYAVNLSTGWRSKNKIYKIR